MGRNLRNYCSSDSNVLTTLELRQHFTFRIGLTQLVQSEMAVLTGRTLQAIRQVFHLGSRIGCHPYTWDKSTGRAQISSSPWQKALWIFNVALSIGQYAFIVYQWRHITSSETASLAKKTFISFVLVFFSFPIFFQLTIMTTWRELPEFVNMYLLYNKQFEGKLLPLLVIRIFHRHELKLSE